MHIPLLTTLAAIIVVASAVFASTVQPFLSTPYGGEQVEPTRNAVYRTLDFASLADSVLTTYTPTPPPATIGPRILHAEPTVTPDRGQRRTGVRATSPADIRSIVEDAARWSTDTIMEIIWCESRYDHHAYNSAEGGNYGLMQINAIHAGKVGGNLASLYDPAVNIRVAAQLYEERGLQPWSACL